MSTPGLFKTPSPAIQVMLAVLLVLGLPSCYILSHDVEAMDRYREALEASGIGELEAAKDGPPAPPDPDRVRRGLELADEALAIEPFFWPAHLLAIDLSNWIEEKDQTDARFQYALSLFPDRTDIRLVYLRFLNGRKADTGRMLSVIRTGMVRDPRSAPLRIACAEALLDAEGNSQEVEELLAGALRLLDLPRESALCGQVALLAYLMAAKDGIEAGSRLMLRIAETWPDAPREGMIMAMASQHERAVEDLFSHVFEHLDPPPALRVARAWLLVFRNRFEEAEALALDPAFAEAAAKSGQPEAVEVIRGYIALGEGRFQEAGGIFSRVLDEHPVCVDALRGMETLVFQSAGPGEASRDFMRRMKKAIRLAEDIPKRRKLYYMLEEYRNWEASGAPVEPGEGLQATPSSVSVK